MPTYLHGSNDTEILLINQEVICKSTFRNIVSSHSQYCENRWMTSLTWYHNDQSVIRVGFIVMESRVKGNVQHWESDRTYEL